MPMLLNLCTFALNQTSKKMNVSLLQSLKDFIQDLCIEPIDDLVPAILEPVEVSYLPHGTPLFLHQPARPCRAQVKPMTKPTLRPCRRSFSLARSNDNSADDESSHGLE